MLNERRICSWNQPVLRNDRKVSCSKPLMGFEPTTDILRVWRISLCVTLHMMLLLYSMNLSLKIREYFRTIRWLVDAKCWRTRKRYMLYHIINSMVTYIAMRYISFIKYHLINASIWGLEQTKFGISTRIHRTQFRNTTQRQRLSHSYC